MENHFLLTDDLLWDYADGLLSPELKRQADAYMEQHPEWKSRLQAVLSEKKALSGLPLLKPQAGFADSIMAAWAVDHAVLKSKAGGQDWIIRGIVVVFGLFILVPLATLIVVGLQTALPVVSLPAGLPASVDIDWSKALSHPALYYSVMLGMTFLVLRLLEKYLQQKGVLGKVI